MARRPMRWWCATALAVLAAGCSRDGAPDRGAAPPSAPDRGAESGEDAGATAGGERGDGASSRKEHVVRVDVESVNDLRRAAKEHRALARSGERGARLEIVFAPGSYDEPALSLSEPSGQPGRVAVEMRGAGGGVTTLVRPRVRLRGSTVQVRDLVIREAPVEDIALEVAVTERAELRDLGFVDTAIRDPSGRGARRRTGVVALQPLAGGATAAIRDTWFVRGRPGARTGLVSVRGAAPRFAEVSFARVAFAGVAGGPAVSAENPETLSFEQCPRLGGAQGAGFVAVDGDDTEVAPADWGADIAPVSDDELDALAAAILDGDHPAPPGGW